MSAVLCETRELSWGNPIEDFPIVSNKRNFPENGIASSSKLTVSSRLTTTKHPTAPEPHVENPFPRTLYLWSAEAVGDVVRSSRTRARSDTLPGSTTASPLGAAARRAYQRERASSTVERPHLRKGAHRPLVPSALSSAITLPTPAPAVLHAGEDGAEGSFTPTSSPRRSLRSILAVNTTPLPSRAPYGVEDPISDMSAQSSPPSSPLVPSICRTPSSERSSDYFPTAPSSAGPVTPMHSANHSPRLGIEPLHPLLESLEDASKFHVRMCCATCKKAGSNFPYCPRCGDKWCSRACRLQGGKRHVCSRSAVNGM